MFPITCLYTNMGRRHTACPIIPLPMDIGDIETNVQGVHLFFWEHQRTHFVFVETCTVVITSNAPDPWVRTHEHTCTRACKQLNRIIGVIRNVFPSCQIVRVRFMIDFCSCCVSWVLECCHASPSESLRPRTNHSTIARWRDSRVHREGVEERRNIHYTSHCDPTDYKTRSDQGGLQSSHRRSWST